MQNADVENFNGPAARRMLEGQLVHESQRRAAKNSGDYNQQRRQSPLGLLAARRICTGTRGNAGMRLLMLVHDRS